MSRLIDIDPQVQPEPEPEGYEFSYYTFDELPDLDMSNVESTLNVLSDIENKETSDGNLQKLPINNDTLHKLQQEDIF